MTAARAAVRFLSPRAVCVLHRESLAEHGGIDGVRDEGLLQSALHRCVNKAAYEPDSTIPELAASLAYGLAMNHPFNDGNKRIAMIASFAFLEMNGMCMQASELDAYEVFMDLAAGRLTEAELAKWLATECE
ncbi:MAG: type II toxin-antitoxin system death-on-curing family toxin [Phycisphaerales bacterium]|jgi:death-on-curing protein